MATATKHARRQHTHTGCPVCRLRFTAAAAYIAACPECGRPPQPIGLDEIVGFRLHVAGDPPQALPEAVAVSIPIPDPRRGR